MAAGRLQSAPGPLPQLHHTSGWSPRAAPDVLRSDRSRSAGVPEPPSRTAGPGMSRPVPLRRGVLGAASSGRGRLPGGAQIPSGDTAAPELGQNPRSRREEVGCSEGLRIRTIALRRPRHAAAFPRHGGVLTGGVCPAEGVQRYREPLGHRPAARARGQHRLHAGCPLRTGAGTRWGVCTERTLVYTNPLNLFTSNVSAVSYKNP